MSRHTPRRILLWACVGWPLGSAAGTASAQSAAPTPAPRPTTPAPAKPKATAGELAILQALAADPTTAAYRFSTTLAGGKVRVGGRVGTKQAHDIAIRIASAFSPSIDDRIVIDTAEAHRAAGVRAATLPIPGYSTRNAPLAGVGAGSGYRGASGFPATYGAYSGAYGSAPYFYPQPLFGRLDEPFYGFEPPPASYPAWFAATAVRDDRNQAPPQRNNPAQGMAPPPAPAPALEPVKAGQGVSASNDTVEMVLDPRGVAVLRGTVPTEADRVGVAQKVSQLPGVTDVINKIEVRDTAQPRPPDPNQPPPPPVPAGQEDRPQARRDPIAIDEAARPLVRGNAGPAAAEGSLERRLALALARRPALAGTNVRASARDGVAYLSGKVPTATEAMAAFRAAQQTPGVREVVDKLEFAVPDGQGKNPLIESGRPEDVEPYLEAQIRRQVGDQAHIDRVRMTGNQLELKGTVPHADDKLRVEAVLRSMPLLRGFRVEAELLPE